MCRGEVRVEQGTENGQFQNNDLSLYDLWVTVRKRKFTILIVVLASVVLALAYTALAQKVYRVSNTLVLNQEDDFITKGEIVAAVKELDRFRVVHRERTARLVGMPVEELGGIKRIRAFEIRGTNLVQVDIDTLEGRAGVALMDALPHFLQTGSNAAEKLRMRRALLEKNRDDLKAIIDNPTKGLGLSSNTIVYVPSIDLYTLREKYNGQTMIIDMLKQGRVITLASRTEPPGAPYKPKRVFTVLMGLCAGFFLGVFAAFFVEWSSGARRARLPG